jgi:RNA polymerase sigma-70 factor (ECF subfamily)
VQDPDFDLVQACLDPADERFEAAFEALYNRYRDRVYSIAYRMLGTTTDAMDAAQDSFSILFRKISSFRFDSKFSTWLFRLVVNCCVDFKRRESARRPSAAGGANVDRAEEVVAD